MSLRKAYRILGMASLLVLSSCQNTLYIGEQHAFDLDVEAKNDASEPAKFNFGYESHTAVVVPPKKPLHSNELSNQDNVPEGDLLSAFSNFSMLREPTTGADALKNDVTIRTGVATGRAAKAIADQIKGTASTPSTESTTASREVMTRRAAPKARKSSSSASGLLQRMKDIAQPDH
jgi:hypothetical protein